MDFLDNQKNYILPDTLYSENQDLRWKGSHHQAIGFLEVIPNFKSSVSLFEIYNIDEFPLTNIKKWTLEDVSKSALFFYLENIFIDRKKIQADLMSVYEWRIISSLIINSEISHSILNFIKELNLVKISQNKKIVSGCFESIEQVYTFEEQIFSEIGLQNLLSFLKIDLDSSKLLIEQAFKNKNLKNIAAFVFTYEASLDKRLVLTQALINYKNQDLDKNLNPEMEKLLNDILQAQFAELDSFDIFDLFESDEGAKSKKILFFFILFIKLYSRI